MNAQERLRRKRRKQMYRKFRVLLPIVVIILLITGLTAGGIILSINQTKKGESSLSDNRQTNEDGTKPEDDEAGTQEIQDEQGTNEEGSYEESTNAAVPSDQDIFETMVADFRVGLQNDKMYLTAANASFSENFEILQAMDTSEFTQDNKDLYDVILDYMQIEALGAAYVNNAPAAGQRMYDVAGGTDYYMWLVKRWSGGQREMQEIHDMLANELNTNFAAVNALKQADVMLAQNSQGKEKNAADPAYQFPTVTQPSDLLMTTLSPDGLANSWIEFGIIRAYQMDSTLDENMKNYLIGSTRMAYAIYGLLDFYVHYTGWTIEQVTNLCNQYFGGGQEAFAQSLYQSILDKPGAYAAAGIGYLELVDIETTLRNNIPDYSEQTLLDFLFDRGPASFRVYWSWVQPAAEAQ